MEARTLLLLDLFEKKGFIVHVRESSTRGTRKDPD